LLLEAASGYFETIRELLIDPLAEREVRQLGRIWQRLRTARTGG
jgi:hypothetical protein